MRVGVVILPEHRRRDAAPLWQRAEQLGFAHAWTYDHLSWRDLRDSAWFGAIPTLAAAAMVTDRIRLGPLVASANFRHPVPFAKEIVTLDDVSDGRLIVGLGAGGTGWDASVLGGPPWSPRERSERFAEFVALTDQLLRDGATSHTGRYYSAVDARTVPGCVQQPRVPFAIAATGPRGLLVAAKYAEIWVTNGHRAYEETLDPARGAEVVRRQSELLEQACAAVGRNPHELQRLVLTGLQLQPRWDSADAFRDALGRYAEAGATDLVVHWPRPSEPYRGDAAAFERVMSEVLAP